MEDTVVDEGAGRAERHTLRLAWLQILVLNALSIAVAECAVVPAFIQGTVVPTFTFISFGVNSNSFMVAVGPPGAGACATAMWPLVWRSRVTTHTNNPRNLAGGKMFLLSLRQVRQNRLERPCSGVCWAI